MPGTRRWKPGIQYQGAHKMCIPHYTRLQKKMKQINNILFPTDFSDIAEAAQAYAAILCKQFGATLHIVHARQDTEQSGTASHEYVSVEQQDWSPSFQEYVALQKPEKLQVDTVSTTEIAGHSISEILLNYADLHDIDLIVLGTHGHRGIGRILLGSTAEKIVRLAKCSVLTVGGKAHKMLSPEIGRILVPIDFSEFSLNALDTAQQLAQPLGAEISLLHVFQPISFPLPYGVTSPNIMTAEVRQRTQRALDALGENSAEIRVTTHTEHGFPEHEINAFAQKNDVDLIVIASHGLTGFNRFIQGSVSQEVVRQAPCPVYTVKRDP